MNDRAIPFTKSLGGRMFLLGIVPMGLVLASVVLVAALQMARTLRDTSEETLRLLADRAANEIERGNTHAVMAAQIMAQAQVEGMFGDRAQSSNFARSVLDAYPEFTGAYFGYEPNADDADTAYVDSDTARKIGHGFDPRGRFIPYWYRDQNDNRQLLLEPLVDMESSLYYQGCKDLFQAAGHPVPQVTEPYVYEGKMIVEQTYPIVIDGRFMGIAGVDRALSDIVRFLQEISHDDKTDVFLISRAGSFVASTLASVPLGDGRTGELRTLAISESPYRELFGRFHTERTDARLERAPDPILGESCYFAAAPVPTGDWLVVVRKTEASVMAPIRNQTAAVLGAVALALAIVTLLSWWITHKTTRRIRNVVTAADALARGQVGTEVLVGTDANDETGRLAESFDELVANHRRMTVLCKAIAAGDFTNRLDPRSEHDELVIAINEMADARHRAEQRVTMLLDTAPVGLLLVDRAGVIRSANEEADRIFGYDRGELEGSPVDALVPESIRGHHPTLRDGYFADPDRRIMAKGRELKGVCKDGSEIFAEIGLAPIELPEGLMIAAAVHDVSDRKEAERALARSEERFALTVRGSGDGLWDFDPATGELWYAERFRELLGYSGEEEYPNVVASWSDGLHPHDRQPTLDAFAAHLERDVPYDVVYRLRTKSGEYRWFRARGISLRDDTGRSYRAAGSITDITDQKLAEASLRKLSSAVEQSPTMVVITNCDGIIEYVNPKFTEVTGYTASEVLGQAPSILNSGEQPRKFYANLWQTILAGREWSGEFCNRKKSGELIWEQASISPIRDDSGQTTHFVAVKEDITERKRTADELREAKERAEEATRAKSTFLANMSHEIRTPMNGVLGMTELALDTDLTSEQREYLNTVQSSGEALLALINDILDFSKIEAGKLELDPIPFSLRDALADMLNTLAAKAHSKGIELLYDVPPELHNGLIGDVFRVRQIIVNLVGNAIKFTEEGEIIVSVDEVGRTEHEIELHFAIRDTGVGIPKDRLEAIFQPFEQADLSTTKQYGGTGLGLTISTQLAECMGGRLWADSELGKGSTFQFTAVFGIGDHAARTDDVPRPDRLDDLRVLIVDDNETNRRILERTASNWNMNPLTVPSGADAIAAMDRAANAGAPFKLILSDVHMPGMDGFELVERLNAHEQHRHVPVIMLTSASRSGDAARCREMGVAAHLIKPVKQSLLLDAIVSVICRDASSIRDAEPSTHRPPTPEPDRTDEQPALRILLAEDNRTNQKFAVRTIEKAGHSVVVANNGRDAVEAIQAQPFEVVLMDIHMPEMDGYEATAAIRDLERQSDAGARTPIIAMTANAMKGDRERCLEAGMDGYVAKPVKRAQLFAEIDRVLRELG